MADDAGEAPEEGAVKTAEVKVVPVAEKADEKSVDAEDEPFVKKPGLFGRFPKVFLADSQFVQDGSDESA